MNNNIKVYFIPFVLFLIFAGALFVRTYKLSSNPAGFFCDEASYGYNAHTIITQGRDEAGNIFPLLFEAYHGTFFHPGLPIYLIAIPTAIFGLSEFMVRINSAILGSLLVLLLYILCLQLTRNRSVALLSAFLLSISPWAIHFSRVGFVAIYFVFFLTLSICLFLSAIRHKSTKLFLTSGILFGLTLYTYVPAYILIPLFLASLGLIYKKPILTFPRKTLFLFAVIFTIAMTPIVIGLVSGKTSSRYIVLNQTNQKVSLPERAAKSFDTYLDHFSLDFLFFKGDLGFQNHFITRHSVRGFGELFLLQLPFFLLGIRAVWRHKNNPHYRLILAWTLLYPIASSLVPLADGGGPFANRSIIGVIPLQIISAVGFFEIIRIVKKQYIRTLIISSCILISLFSIQAFLKEYFIRYPLYSSDFWGWQYGAKDIVHYFLQNEDKYDQLIMAPEFNAPDIFFKFYAPNGGCEKCIVGLPNTSYSPNLNQLFAVTPGYILEHPQYQITEKERIIYPNGSIAFIIGEVVK